MSSGLTPTELPHVELVPQPANFGMRVVAYILDGLILAPVSGLSVYCFLALKSLPLVFLLSLPGLVYKPFMEARFGATLGKMICKLRVTDREGRNLNLMRAYLRFTPFLLLMALGVANNFWVFSQPEFQEETTFLEMARFLQRSPFHILTTIFSWVVILECLAAAFTERGRAVHDMLAGSYCVRKAG
jgi:uncharacterized RDD family membrane protein YckC